MRYAIPLVVFLLLAGVLVVGLDLDPRRVPSPLIDRAAPAFSLPPLDRPDAVVSKADFLGKVWLLNVWASWCTACLEEHPLLLNLSEEVVAVPIIGLNYKDNVDDAKQWLARWGNPYHLSLTDMSGRVGLDWGVYGVPETFVIDYQGIIRYKHIGPLQQQDITETILPLLRQLQNNP